ncbi:MULTISPECIES: hypothetical protein [unclassified Polaromonas]|jgi:hypothetical protein|uniref:hypothetical protein n=1 Tax=unclassified Polaromonas TaxID=2638319 RepID=UPI0025F30BB5|nr:MULTISPECIES: hypothetical protein [unclassified Polaromonas]
MTDMKRARVWVLPEQYWGQAETEPAGIDASGACQEARFMHQNGLQPDQYLRQQLSNL